jgi:hypothetical protein
MDLPQASVLDRHFPRLKDALLLSHKPRELDFTGFFDYPGVLLIEEIREEMKYPNNPLLVPKAEILA